VTAYQRTALSTTSRANAWHLSLTPRWEAFASLANSKPSLLSVDSRWRVYRTTGLSSPARQSSAGGRTTASIGITSHQGNHNRTPSQNPSSDGCAECLNETLFSSLDHAREVLIEWKDDYNKVRPHSSLGNLPPTTYAKRSVPVMQRDGSLRNTPVASPSLNRPNVFDHSLTLGAPLAVRR
jgi:hypothetical protein